MKVELDRTNQWFEGGAMQVFDQIMPQIQPKTYLEIGCFEGVSLAYMLERYPGIKAHAIDSWEGGQEHRGMDMEAVRQRFIRNINAMCEAYSSVYMPTVRRAESRIALSEMQVGYDEYFDCAYIDGSHRAGDVLSDSVLTFPLMKVGGVMIWDDYTWCSIKDGTVLECPKMGIDCFLNVMWDKIRVTATSNAHIIAVKTKP
jgi:hypothetical protein